MGKLRNLKSASLIDGNTKLCVLDPTYNKRVKDAKKNKSTVHIPKQWFFFNLKTAEKEWTIPHAEAVFFKGADSGKEIDVEADLDQEEGDTENEQEVFFMDPHVEISVEHKMEKKFWRLKRA